MAVRGLHEQMIVGPHQTVGMTAPVRLLDFSPEELQEPTSVLVRLEDRLPRIATRRDMVDGSRTFNPQRSRHGGAG